MQCGYYEYVAILLHNNVQCAYYEQVAICFQARCNARTTSKLQSAFKQSALRWQASFNLLPRRVYCAYYEKFVICFQAMRSSLTSKLQSASKQGAMHVLRASCNLLPGWFCLFKSWFFPISSCMAIIAKTAVILLYILFIFVLSCFCFNFICFKGVGALSNQHSPDFVLLKVVSSEMDPSKIRLIQ
jgi:hypothetical protein